MVQTAALHDTTARDAMDFIDLRSDTVTWPTAAMRVAMANARVGDDVYGDDPTVNELEAEAAALFGKEAAVLVTSGTMGNLASVMAHCARGDEIILGNRAHIFRSEAGSPAVLAGVHPHPIPQQPDGTLALADIRAALRDPHNEHHPRSRLIALENTQALTGGMPLSAAYTAQVAELARENGLRLHIDGARIFNAAAALGVPVKKLTAGADSVTFCLSKGLCAPAGSVVVGSHEFIRAVRRARKVLGGGLRQAGILAAAGLIAIREMSTRLSEDHDNARALAEGLATVPHVHVEPERVRTNFIFFELDEKAPLAPRALSERLERDYKIRLTPYAGGEQRTFRALTHYWITRESVDRVIEALRALLL